MKRFILAAVLGLVAASSAWATDGQSAPFTYTHNVVQQLRWRTHRSTYTPGTVGYVLDGFTLSSNAPTLAVDSVTANRVGAATVADTTAPVNTLDWGQIGSQPADSALVCSLNLFDNAGADLSSGNVASQSGCDSVYVAVQGSFGNGVWATLGLVAAVRPSAGVPGTIAGAATPGWRGALSLQGASATNPAFIVKYVHNPIDDPACANVYSLNKFPLIRFIVVMPKAVGYVLQASLTHPTTSSAQ